MKFWESGCFERVGQVTANTSNFDFGLMLVNLRNSNVEILYFSCTLDKKEVLVIIMVKSCLKSKKKKSVSDRTEGIKLFNVETASLITSKSNSHVDYITTQGLGI